MKKFLVFFILLVSIAIFAETTIKVAVWSWDVELYKKIVESFNKEYPDIKVEIVVNEPDVNGFLTAKSAAGEELPDVVAQSWMELYYPVSQGWVYPLNEFVENDPDFAFVPKQLQNSYSYNGTLFALPERLHFNTIILNLDLLEKLNLKKPSYLWDINQFRTLARRGTTREYSGIDNLWEFDTFMAAVLTDHTSFWSFDLQNWKFDLQNGGWIPAITLQKQLKSVPGLVAGDLFNQEIRDNGELDDYQKKFGRDADAFMEGKILMGFRGTWAWYENNLKELSWNYDMYPVPNDPKYGLRIPTHVNYAFMTSTTKHPKEAFLFLKYLTYDPNGVKERLRILTTNKDVEGKLTKDWFIPATMHPEVIKYFDSVDFIPEGVKYMLKRLDRTVQVDLWKIVPGWWGAIWDVIFPVNEKIRAGEVEPEAVAAETEEKANEIIQKAWIDFEKNLNEFLNDFNSKK